MRKNIFFFHAELYITDFFMRAQKCSMRPLLLYQSIIDGLVIIDKYLYQNKKIYQITQSKLYNLLEEIMRRKLRDESDESDEKRNPLFNENGEVNLNHCDEKVDLTVNETDILTAKEYQIKIFEHFICKNKNIYINHEQILNHIGLPKLRAKFILQDKKQFQGYSDKFLQLDKYGGIKLHAAETYIWTVRQQELDELRERLVLASGLYRFGEKETLVKFYCQIDLRGIREYDEDIKENDEGEQG
eukprot:128394_1